MFVLGFVVPPILVALTVLTFNGGTFPRWLQVALQPYDWCLGRIPLYSDYLRWTNGILDLFPERVYFDVF